VPSVVGVVALNLRCLTATLLLLALAAVSGCSKRGATSPPSAKASEQQLGEAASPALVTVTPTLNVAGLVVGLPQLGSVSGRVMMEGAIGKAEIALYEFDLSTNTSGRQIGLALSEPNGDFHIKYLLQQPTTFLQLEARNVEYRSPNDGVIRRVASLSSVIDGLPGRSEVRVVVSPVTNVVFARFRFLVRSGMEASIAYLSAVSETLSPNKGTGWALESSPMIVHESKQETSMRAYALAWEEVIRFEKLSASSFYEGMADDYEDGTWNAVDGEGEKIAVESDGRGRVTVPEQFYTGDLARALQRYQLCQRPDLARDDPQRLSFRCATPAALAAASSSASR